MVSSKYISSHSKKTSYAYTSQSAGENGPRSFVLALAECGALKQKLKDGIKNNETESSGDRYKME